MMNKYSTPLFRALYLIVFLVFPMLSYGQLGADMESSDNTNCDGAPCDYNGPSILINELMLSPQENDGSMWGGTASQKGEWIELYNPNICESVDISCFYLGNNANDGGTHPGGYVIPPGTIVPAAGFALIRGVNAAAVPSGRLVENGGNVVELVVTGDGVCVGGGTRLWFPNSGGWFAFYDNNGVPQDAVSWTAASNTDNHPCTPTLTGCGFSGTLANYAQFPNDRKNYILTADPSNSKGKSVRRIPDGGTWSGVANPTYATCNSVCINPQTIVCNGTAIAEPYGGTPPYTYVWNDSKAQTTQTATQLCAGEFCVTITDGLNNIYQQCVTVQDISYDIHISADICEGATYTLPNNTTVTEAGVYPVLLSSGQGCDSLVTVDLAVHPNFSFELDPQICLGDIYILPDGVEVTQTGNYQVLFQSQFGCDSIYTVNLVVSNPIDIPVNVEICEGKTYKLPDGSEVSDPGLYEILISGGGITCDTLYKVNLDFYPGFQIDVDALNHISCHGEIDGSILLEISGSTEPYTYVWSDGIDHGTTASNLEHGEYSVMVTDTHGCESNADFEIIEPQPVSISASADELICFGSESELSASANGGTGNFTYHWSHTASNDANVMVSPQQDATYSVYASDENSCETESIILNVSVINMYADSLKVSPPDSICAGGEITVYAYYDGDYPPYTYTWSHGLPNGVGPHSVSPNETTTYTVTVQDDCANEITKTVSVTVLSLPVAETSSLSDISCFGLNDGIAQISVTQGTPNYTFTWSDGLDHGSEASNLEPGEYSVVVKDIYGCESVEKEFEIIEPQPVSISASANELICFGSESELSASANGGTGNFSYHWNHTTSNAASIMVSPQDDTIYFVFASDQNGCETDSVILNVAVINMFADSLEVSPADSICAGEQINVSAYYNGDYPPYTYTWTHGLPNGAGPHSVSPNETTIYTVTVQDDCGNEITKAVSVTVLSLPIAEISSITDISCFGLNDGTAQISVTQGTPNYTFTWSDGQAHGATGQNLTPGAYEVHISDVHGCEDDISFAISEPQLLQITLTGDELICVGSESNLVANATGGIDNIVYHWNHTNDNNGELSVNPTTDNTYTVYAGDANGCNTDPVSIEISVIDMDQGLLHVSGDTAICPGEVVSILGSYSGAYPPYNFNWSNGLGAGAGPHSVSVYEPIVYTLTVSDVCDNSLTADVTISLYDNPVAVISTDLLSGCSPFEFELYDPVNTSSGFSHEWRFSNGAKYYGNPVNGILEYPDIYEVRLFVTSPEGCSTSSITTKPIEVYELPIADFSASKWSTGIDDPQIIFTNTGSGFTSSTWNIVNTNFEDQNQISYTFQDTGKYNVHLFLENEFGCRDSIMRQVTINVVYDILIPNAFTPGGGSGDNPYYDPTSTSNSVFYPFSEYVVEYAMSVFNRWGEMVFESTEFEKGWNGTYRDKPCPQDVYVYKIQMVYADGNKVTKVGDVTLFR